MSKYGDIKVDRFLTNYSIKYGQGLFVASEVFPFVKVDKESDKYPVYGKQDKRIYDTVQASNAEANEVDPFEIESTPTYTCDRHALKHKISQDDIDAADKPIDLEVDATGYITENLMLAHEKRAADLATAAATFATSGHTATRTGTAQWDNASYTGDIEEELDAAKETIRAAIGFEPNHIVIPAAVAKVMKRDSNIRALRKFTNDNLLINGDLPATLFNMKVLIPGGIYDSANHGATYSGSDVWGKHVLLFYKSPGTPRKKMMTFGQTFFTQMRRVDKWDTIDPRGKYVRADEKNDVKVVCEYAAYLIRNVIS